MARLADDWSAQRQVCVDVLCAYLRMPWPSEGDAVRSSDGKVREAILSVTSSHLRGDRDVPDWKTLNFDFSGAVFRSIRLYNIAFASVSNFTGARFEGMNTFERCTFLQGANFDHCSIEGRLFLDDIAVAGNQMVSKGGELLCFTLDKAHVGEYGELIIRPAAITESGQIFGYDTRVDGLLCIDSREMRAPCGTIIFNGFKLGAASKLMINKAPTPHRGFNPAAKFVYPRISFIYPDVERGASVAWSPRAPRRLLRPTLDANTLSMIIGASRSVMADMLAVPVGRLRRPPTRRLFTASTSARATS